MKLNLQENKYINIYKESKECDLGACKVDGKEREKEKVHIIGAINEACCKLVHLT